MSYENINDSKHSTTTENTIALPVTTIIMIITTTTTAMPADAIADAINHRY